MTALLSRRLGWIGFFTVALASAGCSSGGPAPQAVAQPVETIANWPQFRGAGGLGVSKAKGLPVAWSAQKNVVWKVELPGPGGSSPVVWGERLFLTCYSGYGVSGKASDMKRLRRHLICLNSVDGKVLWNKQIEPAAPDQEYGRRIQLHGYASSTPAVDGERVYAFFGTSGVFAFDHAGTQLWRASVGVGMHEYGSATSPVLYRDMLIVNASVENESLVALNCRSGKVVWQAPGIRESWNTPLLVDLAGGKTELVVTLRGQVIGLDPANGQRLWTCRGVDDYMVPSAVAHQGVVYALLGRDGTVLAVRAGGRGDVSNSHVLWRVSKGRNVASPVYYQGHLYFVPETLGVARCLDAKTGQAVYEQRLEPPPGEIYASPIIADGKLYYVSRQRGVYVLVAGPKFQLLAHNDLADPSIFNASPVVAGNRLLLRSDRYLYCLGEK
jgi:outer membrane protein assembly factor BamB